MPEDLRFDLDHGGRHALEFSANRVTLRHPHGSRRSALHDALKRHLVLLIADTPHRFGDTDALDLPAKTVDVRLADLPLGRVDLTGPAPRLIGHRYLLSPFESRFLAENGLPHPSTPDQRTANHNLTTDLHVHFAGCFRPLDLLRIAIDADVRYPRAYLEEVGVRPNTAAADVPLADVPADFLAPLEAALSIPLDRRIPFVEMERIYRLRRPITKSRAAFIPLIRQLAQDYAAMGVRYAELSLSDIVEAERLRVVHRELPAIEAQAGVTIRFLAGIGRHDDPEWDLDLIDRIESLGQSRYLAGVDFMGHEDNSTRDFESQIRAVAAWAGSAGGRPGFVIRVHAGENPAYPENVRVAVEAAAAGGANIQLRIGHGLYGVDDATLDLLRDRGVIVEFNLNSNLALNNIQSAKDAPIVRYLRAGVRVVLGTDGYGIYQTTPELEARAALLCGVAPADFAAIRKAEADYVELRRSSDERHTVDPAAYVVPDDVPHVHYVQGVLERKTAAARARDAALAGRLKEIGVPVLDDAGVDALLRGKRCVSVAGAWNKAWDRLTGGQQMTIRREMAALLDGLDPAQTVLITGGTRLGVEGVVQGLAKARGFSVLGTIVKATPPDWVDDGRGGGGVTHVHVVGAKLYDKAAGLYTLVKRHDGVCLFVGGGSIVNDEIQTAINLRLRHLLMDGPPGASTERAKARPADAFRTAAEALAVLNRAHAWGGTNEPYWHTGANPTVDLVVTRRAPGGGRQVLLIRRDHDAPTEGGKWALPGGFQHTTAPRNTAWRADIETPRQAAVRELREETGLDVAHLADRLTPVGAYEGGHRDPRDTPDAWSRAEVYAIDLPDALAAAPLCGADDACDAQWFDVSALPPDLAFDHAKILADAFGTTGVTPVNTRERE